MNIAKIPAVPKPQNPELLDLPIGEIQDVLKSELPWLDYSFGKCQKLTEMRDRKQYVYPGVHISNGKYINVFPDDRLGNYSFVDIQDPQEIQDFTPKQFNDMEVNIGIVFWFNLDKIFAGSPDRNLESVKAQVLDVLTRKTFLRNGSLSLLNVYEEAKNIYKGYSINEIDSQFLTQPYSGLRIDGTLKVREAC